MKNLKTRKLENFTKGAKIPQKIQKNSKIVQKLQNTSFSKKNLSKSSHFYKKSNLPKLSIIIP